MKTNKLGIAFLQRYKDEYTMMGDPQLRCHSIVRQYLDNEQWDRAVRWRRVLEWLNEWEQTAYVDDVLACLGHANGCDPAQLLD